MNAILPFLTDRLAGLAQSVVPQVSGRVLRYDGLIVETTGFPASPGSLCLVDTEDGGTVQAEVIGFQNGRNMLLLDEPRAVIVASARVRTIAGGQMVGVGPELLGRVIDAKGAPLDGLPMPRTVDEWPLDGRRLNPLLRQPVTKPLDVGVRIINAALTVGQGQRIGIVAGSGVGKSVLMGMMVRFTSADVIVVGLIGERAREVGDFVGHVMQGEAAKKLCLVAVPADRSPLLRLRAARRATAIAEYFAAQGKQVLLIMDSLTRVAHAQREIGLALGEQPTAKGYPPSVVSLIPNLIERTGPGLANEGAITAIYTVLADGDDTTNDPVVDSARAILDGHFVLSRRQTQMGLYPAIDIPQSVSRVMNDIVDPEHRLAATRLKRLISTYLDNRDLMLLGGYVPGQDPVLDEAASLWPRIEGLIRQNQEQSCDFATSRAELIALTAGGAGLA
ncbi:MAG: flagellum-specific ATP synthase FliI [Rhodobacterales bacterium RIFCSPHIGHO2_02_FULL_62_130]|jgi:flagellum-specific ATP synthase|nr:MAG: flagellum-specific ATP synthase FliI [Rhodobacterales bacterium RIFCSPHIGHO2_02_FULL_62_130]OHC55967.1 MAG: flagellum-specific ATP synthase FliI [Rhodobacterales bacterium RIFCSPHIGHO2_12_FULL_62_75]HCY99934.1 flagellum-specific ATP synthase FliI [Rhodobacter sp.]